MPLHYRRVLPPRFSADHEATRLILDIGRAFTSRGAHATTNGTSLTFSDFPGDSRLRGLVSGSCTIERSHPGKPTLVLAYTFSPAWVILAVSGGVVLAYVLWTAHNPLSAIGCAFLSIALMSAVTVGLGWLRLRLAISDGLRAAG